MKLLAFLVLSACAATREAGLERVEHCRMMACRGAYPEGAAAQRQECIEAAVLRCRWDGIDEDWCRPSPGETYRGQCARGGGL